MLSSVARVSFSWIGWRYIPDIASRRLLAFFYRFYQGVLRRQPPTPGTPQYERHRRWTYAFVVFGYALYTFYDAARTIGPNYYELLRISPLADEYDLKSGFRAFAKKYHPDRAGPEAEPLFMSVRDAYEALKKPVTRFAYDRFGSEALNWTKQQTMQEYLSRGLYQTAAYYVVSVCALLFWNKIAPRSLAFWNYIILFGSFALELWFILGPSPSQPSGAPLSSYIFTDPASPTYNGVFTWLWPDRVAYQHIVFLRSFSLLLSSALYQIVPNLFPPSVQVVEPAQMLSFISRLNSSSKAIDQELYSTVQADLHSCHGKPTGTEPSFAEHSNITPMEPAEPVRQRLRNEIQDLVLENVLLSQGGPLRSACEAAIRRRAAAATGQRAEAGASRPVPVRTPSHKVDMVENYFGSGRTPEGGYVRARSLSF